MNEVAFNINLPFRACVGVPFSCMFRVASGLRGGGYAVRRVGGQSVFSIFW